MGDYIYPCPKKGRCRQIALNESMAIHVPVFAGVKRIERLSPNHQLPEILNYTCCNMCYLPIDFHEAVKLNQFLGNKLPDTPVDEDFMKVLDGI